MRLLSLAGALRNAGLNVLETSGWQDRGSADFSPAGVIVHHTAGPTKGDAPSLNVCIKGRSDLPGPLCQLLLGRSGTFYIVASARANHAGTGAWRGVSGNRRFVGIEAENTGVGEKWPAVQIDAFERGTAAVCRLIKCNAEMVCGHKEYAPGRKIDPRDIDMHGFRARVAELLAAPQAPPSEEDDMFTDEDRRRLEDIHALLTQKGDPSGFRKQIDSIEAKVDKPIGELRRNVRRVGKAVKAEGIEGA